MADPFHFPEPSEHDPSSPTSPPESVLRRKKPFVPPGFAVSTTITSHGYQAGELHLLEDIKCHDHRQRYPEVEALVQMFFRIGAILLDLSVLIAVGILDAKSDVFTTAKTVYAVAGYSLLLNMVELVSLGNPRPKLLIAVFPWLFPVCKSRSSLERRRRFLRLPSLYLAICECVAMIACFWSAILFLNPIVKDDSKRDDCPVATCVTQEEKGMVKGYIREVCVALVHIGFFLMAVVHFVKRKGPEWLASLET